MRYPPAVVFDLDGTLVDTAGDLHLILREVMDGEGLPAPSLPEIRAMVGDGARVLLQRAFAAAGVAPDAARLDRLYDVFLERYVEEPCRASRVFEGAAEALDELRAAGCRLAICTNKPHLPSRLLVEALGVADRFDLVLGGDSLPGIRKPDPRHLAAVLHELGAPKADAVMVGDSRNDLLTAQALGVPCVLVSFGYTTVPARELGAQAVIDGFGELLPALARLRADRLDSRGSAPYPAPIPGD